MDFVNRLAAEFKLRPQQVQAAVELLPNENVKIYPYLLDGSIVENLDNYCDYVHHSGDVCGVVLDGKGYGSAYVKKFGDWEATVE